MDNESFRKYSAMSAFGGNAPDASAADAEAEARRQANYQSYVGSRNAFQTPMSYEDWLNKKDWTIGYRDYGPEVLPGAEGVDMLARARQQALAIPSNSRAGEIGAARGVYDQARQEQIGLLSQIANQRSSVPLQRQMSLNAVQQQLAAATDPRARLLGLRSAAAPMSQQAGAQAVAEAGQREAGTIGGAGQVRVQDLLRAQQERQELGRQIAAQVEREKLALGLAQTAEQDIASMANSELGLAAIAAQQKGGIDFWRDVFPGMTTMASAGLGLAATGPGVQPQIGGAAPIGVSQPMGNVGAPYTPANAIAAPKLQTSTSLGGAAPIGVSQPMGNVGAPYTPASAIAAPQLQLQTGTSLGDAYADQYNSWLYRQGGF